MSFVEALTARGVGLSLSATSGRWDRRRSSSPTNTPPPWEARRIEETLTDFGIAAADARRFQEIAEALAGAPVEDRVVVPLVVVFLAGHRVPALRC